MQSANKTGLTVKIVDLFERDKKVLYGLEIQYQQESKWQLLKSFDDFMELNKKLSKIIPNAPTPPQKGLFATAGGDALYKQKVDLEKYLKELSARTDIFTSPHFQEFLEMEKNQKIDPLTRGLGELGDLPFSARTFEYVQEEGLLFIGTGDSDMFKFANLLSFLSKSTVSVDGMVLAYRECPVGSLSFTKLWQAPMRSAVTALAWNEKLNYLAVGMDNGEYQCLKLFDNNECYEVVITGAKQHANAITGVAFNNSNTILMASSLDKYISLTNISKGSTRLIEDKLHSNPLTALVHDKVSDRLILADSVGNIMIYAFESPLTLLGIIESTQNIHLTSLYLDANRKYLFAGSKQGLVMIYEIEKHGRERFSANVGSFQSVKDITSLCYDTDTRELYVGNQKGTVIFIKPEKSTVFYVLEAHDAEITHVRYFPSLRLMITCGKDKQAKFFTYPFDRKKDFGSKTRVKASIMKQKKGSYDDSSEERQRGEKRESEKKFSTDDDTKRELKSTAFTMSKQSYNEREKDYNYGEEEAKYNASKNEKSGSKFKYNNDDGDELSGWAS